MRNEAEVVAAYRRLTDGGVKVRTQSLEWQGPEAWMTPGLVTRSLYVDDPEGNGVELTADMLKNWQDIRLVGFEEAVAGPGGAFSVLQGDYWDCSISLFPAAANLPPGVHHQAFELVEDGHFDGSTERLRRMGVPVELRVDHPGKTVLYIRDTDGVLSQYYRQEPDFVRSLAAMDPGIALFLT